MVLAVTVVTRVWVVLVVMVGRGRRVRRAIVSSGWAVVVVRVGTALKVVPAGSAAREDKEQVTQSTAWTVLVVPGVGVETPGLVAPAVPGTPGLAEVSVASGATVASAETGEAPVVVASAVWAAPAELAEMLGEVVQVVGVEEGIATT